MSSRKTKIFAMTVLSGAALVVACGGGSGPVIDVGAPYDQQGGAVTNNPVASDRDPSPAAGGGAAGPATGVQPAGDNDGTSGTTSGGTSGKTTSGGTSGTTTSGGTSGTMTSGGTSGTTTSGGTSGTMAGCPPCDGTFTCDVTVTGQPTQKTTVPLMTKNGVCTFATQGGEVVFACGGTLTSNGQNAGTWANCRP